MGFRRFRFQCALRAGMLSVTLGVFAFLLIRTTLYATLLLIAGLAIYQTVSLIRYVERTNRQLTRFLESITYADLSQTFTGRGLGASYDELNAAFTRVTEAFRQIRAEREEQYRYLQTVVQHIGVGVMAFRPDGTMELLNHAARRLLRVAGEAAGNIRHLTALSDGGKPFADTLLSLSSGDRALIKTGDVQLALHATGFKMQDRQLMLVSVQNIRTELEEKEMEAWQNLIRVLTHEIMNSVTPIASLASTANELVEREMKGGRASDHPEATNDIRTALKTIQSRSEGLLHFVQSYRTLTRIPPPELRVVPVKDLFARVVHLLKTRLETQGILLEMEIRPDHLEATVDPELMEQALINLLTNAMQALEGRSSPRIWLRGRRDEQGRVVIQAADNGPGILPEVQDRIFIPFFTTKQDGSGIGLSLSRQIMRLHGGTITVQSTPDVETTFTLRF